MREKINIQTGKKQRERERQSCMYACMCIYMCVCICVYVCVRMISEMLKIGIEKSWGKVFSYQEKVDSKEIKKVFYKRKGTLRWEERKER